MKVVLTDDEVEYAKNVGQRRYYESRTENGRFKNAEELEPFSVEKLNELRSHTGNVSSIVYNDLAFGKLSETETKEALDLLAAYDDFIGEIDRAIKLKREKK
jgi:hypothetical protein